MHPLLQRLRRLPFPERLILGALLLIAGSVLAFVQIAGEVIEGDTQKFDERILLAFRQPGDPTRAWGPQWVLEAARDVTAFGGVVGITLITGTVLGFLALARKWRAAALVLASVAGGLIVSFTLKNVFSRNRPTVVLHFDEVYTSSFPSGHSMLSTVTYLTLGALLARYTKDRRQKMYFLSVAATAALLIGLSRIYLGVHYPTDVLAGWCAGLAWALLCAVIARWLQARGEIEKEPLSSDP